MAILRTIKTRTALIVKSAGLTSLESFVSGFEIELWDGTSSAPTALKTSTIVSAVKADDFSYVAASNVIFNGLTFGSWYWLRSRVVDQVGLRSPWSSFQAEQAGDNVNIAKLSFPTDGVASTAIKSTSTGITFKMTLSWPGTTSGSILDYDHVDWYYDKVTVASGVSDQVPIQSGNSPASTTLPLLLTTALDSNNIAQITLNDDRLSWYTVWCRAIDQSGNIGTAFGTNVSTINGWAIVGVGKISGIDLQADADSIPPDNTASILKAGSVPTFILDLATTAATGGGSNFIDKAAQSWTIDGFVGEYIDIIAGQGSGQRRKILSNTATRIYVTQSWVIAPNNTSTFRVLKDNWL